MNYRIQSIVFPTEAKHMQCQGLFFRGGEGVFDREEPGLLLGAGQSADLVTYINGCSWAKWKKYTHAQQVTLHLFVEGPCEILYLGCRMEYREIVRTEFGVRREEDAGTHEVVFPYPDNDDTMIGAEISAYGVCRLHGGYYEVACPDDSFNDVELSLSTTTCRKEDYIRKNIALIRERILEGDDELKDHLEIHVVDNGRTLRPEEIEAPHVRLHPNPNTGGAGGFARGMLESLHQEKPATHVLLMDDDVLILPESILRTYHLLRLLREEYRERFISGAMLRYERPEVQHEDIGTISQDKLFQPLKPPFDQRKLRDILKNDGAYYRDPHTYAAWWYCCIPAAVIRKNGLPMPFFVRGDDSEYSLRCGAQFITMNGIFIWHLGFALKFSPAMDIYQQFRNLHIAQASSDAMRGVDIHAVYRHFFQWDMFKFNYGALEQYLHAFEDFLKGPSFIETADGEALLKENSRLSEHYEPLSAHPEIPIRVIEDCYEDDEVKFTARLRDRIFFHLTHNGQRLCPESWYKRDGALPAAAFDFSLQSQKIARRRRYAAVNPFSETAVVRAIDKERYRALMKKYRQLEKEYRKKKPALEKAYREAHPYLTSEAFWRKYLGLEQQ